jgi:predicted metal-dependent phosphoesterase TrpH
MIFLVDLSSLIAKKRQGPKSSAQTPAKPEERKKGSQINEPGSAGTTPEAKERAKEVLKRKDEKQLISKAEITFSEKVTNALKQKVKEHNAKYSKKVSLSQLKKVYRRGLGAFSASHRPNVSRAAWAMARVLKFLKMASGGKVKDAYRRADQDILNSK